MRLSTMIVFSVIILGFSAAAVLINNSYRKEDKEVVSVLKEEVNRLEAGLKAANNRLDEVARKLAELEKAAKQVEGPKVSKADFDNALAEYQDDTAPKKPGALIIAGMNHKGTVGMKGKDFIYGGKIWFQVVGKMPGQLTLYQFFGNEWLRIGGWDMDVPRTIQGSDIPEECRPDGHLPVGRYRLEFDGSADNEAHAEHEFSVVPADKPAAEKTPEKVTLLVLDQKGNPLPEEIPAGTHMVFQLTLPTGEEGGLHLVRRWDNGKLWFLKKVKVSGPGITKMLETDLPESAVKDGRLMPGEYQLIFGNQEKGTVVSRDFTISGGK